MRERKREKKFWVWEEKYEEEKEEGRNQEKKGNRNKRREVIKMKGSRGEKSQKKGTGQIGK